MKPLVIELYAGLHGWGEGFIREGFRVVGFDIVDMCALIDQPRPKGCQLVLQDVTTLHGLQFRDAVVIVASPPCQEFAFRAQPWKIAKAEKPSVLPIWWSKIEDDMSSQERSEWDDWKLTHPLPPPDNSLFEACFRIQREASEAAGRYIPLIVENVRGAQKWVGQAKWHFGSYYLWGDVPALMPIAQSPKLVGQNWRNFREKGQISPHWRMQKFAATDPDYGIKQGGQWWSDNQGLCRYSSNSLKRREASALMAKIPFPLAQHIARCFRPAESECA